MDDQEKAKIQELDLWRCKEAGRLSDRDGFSEFWHYRTLVRDDVRPNTVRVFPLAVQEAEKQIRYFMEERPSAEFLNRLPHLLGTLFEQGMEEASFRLGKTTRPFSELTTESLLRESYAEDPDNPGYTKFQALRDDLRNGASVHPIRRHINNIRERDAAQQQAAQRRDDRGGLSKGDGYGGGAPEYPV